MMDSIQMIELRMAVRQVRDSFLWDSVFFSSHSPSIVTCLYRFCQDKWWWDIVNSGVVFPKGIVQMEHKQFSPNMYVIVSYFVGCKIDFSILIYFHCICKKDFHVDILTSLSHPGLIYVEKIINILFLVSSRIGLN